MNRRRGRTAAVAAVIAAILAGCAPAAQNGDTVSLPAVVPAPASLGLRPGAPFRLTASVRIEGEADAATALSTLVEARTGLTLAGDGSGDGPLVTLGIERGGAAESYRLVADEASVTVTGADPAGLFYGVQTLGQLIARDGDDWVVPAVAIDDAPRFAYRGVMLDVARHFHPVDTVKAYIDHAAIDRGSRGHDRAHQQAARTWPLATLEVAVGGAGDIFARACLIIIHRQTHAASGPAPFKASLGEDAIQPLGLGLRLDRL